MPTNDIYIERLTAISSTEFDELSQLMKTLSPNHELTLSAMTEAISHALVYVVRTSERKIIASATLAEFHSPTGRKASIEDVVVAPLYQGRGLGKKLMQHLIGEATRLAPIDLQLTSRPSRVAANQLYRTLGFEQRDTNAYKMSILKQE